MLTPNAYEQRRFYLLAMLSQRLGDSTAVHDYIRRLERLERTADANDRKFSVHFVVDLQARLAAAAGRTEEALRLLGPPRPQPDLLRPSLTSYYKANERWLRAELLRTLGRHDEALRWYASFPSPEAYDLSYLAPSHLRRAQIHEERGERAEATRHYERFIELWQDADADLQPLVTDARTRLQRLRIPRFPRVVPLHQQLRAHEVVRL